MNRACCPYFVVLTALAVLVVSALAPAAPPRKPLAPPEFSIDLASPSVTLHGLHPGDVLERGVLRPLPALPAWTLTLVGEQDDLDALSGPHEGMSASDVLTLLFSVDRGSVGASGPEPAYVAEGLPYNVFDQAARGHAAGDAFVAIDVVGMDGVASAMRNNLLGLNNFNEGGNDFVLRPATHASTWLAGGEAIDRLDALGHLPRDDEGRVRVAFFSLTAGSPMLASFGWSGADVLVAFGPSTPGACCLVDQCVQVPLEECVELGGVWLGPTSACDLCEVEGACCLQDGICAPLPGAICAALGGAFEGPRTSCGGASCPQPTAACCLPDGTCVDDTADSCAAAGGAFQGLGSACVEAACPEDVTGACCLPDFTCQEGFSIDACTKGGGYFAGAGTSCAETGCFDVGACCLAWGDCLDAVPGLACASIVGAEFQGAGTTCAETECPVGTIGACCLADGICVDVDTDACTAAGGYFLGIGSACFAFECPPDLAGACCLPDGQCLDGLVPLECAAAGGVYQSPGIACSDPWLFCPLTMFGACCLPDGCLDSFPDESCELFGGVYLGDDSTCDESACLLFGGSTPEMANGSGTVAGQAPDCDMPAPCCLPDAGCEVLDVVDCASLGGHPLEGGVTCDDCVAPAACCVPGEGCIEMTLHACEQVGGAWMGPASTCGDAPCTSASAELPLFVYATHGDLGLQPGDDIDALVVFDEDQDGVFGGNDRVLFSLAPGSPSLGSINGASTEGAAADVYVARPGLPPTLFAAAQILGLGASTDNLDALEAIIRTARPADQAIRMCVQALTERQRIGNGVQEGPAR